MKNKKSVAVICSLLLMGPAVLSTMQSVSTPVVAAEEDEQSQENLVQNGDFSQGTENWATWDGEGGDSTFTVENEQGIMTIHSIAGMHPDWGIPISWSTQFQQPGIALDANTRYEISFDAKSSIARPVTLERTGLSGNPQSNIVIGEEMDTYTVEFNTMQSGTMMLNFLLGNVQHSGLTTPEEEHVLTFDNVSVRSLGDAVEEAPKDIDWQLTWSDEFDGEELDLTKWTIDTGNGFYNDGEWISGWGNNEDQYYHEDNVRVEDGRLILEAKEEQMSDEHGDYDYTSGKILTRDKFYQTYGRFEASMKLPDGQGFWPAFWMMPQDDTYGGWAASGEIDIMENAGSETDKSSGAIHYGGLWPNNTYSHGEYDFQEGSTTEFNTYAVEWEPEEIRWYVNDELFYRTSEWHTAGYEYPAPFNQDFFLILNLAVGGWFGGAADETTEFPAQVEVDYVRVYEDANADYDTTPSLPVEDEEEEDDGLDRNPANWQSVGENLIVDGSFDETTEFGDEDNLSTWNLFNFGDFDPAGGLADFSVVDKVLNVEIQQVGWNWWQMQLFQNISLSEGTYKLSFDMASERERDMRLRLEYSGEGVKVFSVNEGMDTYEMIFHVQEADDFKFLFGFGKEHNDVELDVPYLMTLDNVALHTAEPVEEAPEEPGEDVDGEWVYIGDNLIQNGTFDEFADSQDLVAWGTHNQGDYEAWAGRAEFSVIEEVLNIEIQQVGWDWWQIQLFQDVEVPAGTYKLSFHIASEKERDARVELVRSGLPIEVFSVNEEMNTYEFILDVENGGDLQLLFGLGRLENEAELEVPYTMLLDNVSLREVEFVESEEDEVPENNRDNDNHNRRNHEERGNKDNDNHNRGNHENRGNKDNSNRNTDNNGKSNR